jgi:hypothetical protein
MQLSTHSKFYFGWQITTSNRYIDFNDGSARVATLKLGTYNSLDLAIEITKQMNAVSALDFTVTFNRTTRKYTISSGATFSLLALAGLNAGQSAFTLLGYSTTSDKTAASTYTAENVSGLQYFTQLYIQSYKDTTTNRKAIDGVVNKSASGIIEVIKFGDERFMEGEFMFITDILQESGSINRTNPTGLADYTTFIEWCSEKAPVEFMKDENTVATFQTLILESTEADSKGLDYDIIEMYDRGLPYYYRSGKLKFRLVG